MTLAFVFIECARGLASSVEQVIKPIQGVSETHTIRSGTYYDLLVKVQTENDTQFKATVKALKNIAGIAAVTVSIVHGAMQ
jgi:hypothetical protein